MNPLIIDAKQVEQFEAAGPEVKVIGPDGKAVGVMLTADQFEAMRKMEYAWANAQVTDEELQADLESSRNDPTRYSMEEVTKLVERV